MKDCRILVVEDDHDVRELVADVLATEGFPVEQAPNGAAALQKLRAGFRPDVILTNLLMPLMDGYQLAAELKKHESWARIPIIIITAGQTKPEVLRHVEEVLQQPLDLHQLLSGVKRACAKKR
jgi:CheY-like chemotaxis protein